MGYSLTIRPFEYIEVNAKATILIRITDENFFRQITRG